MFLLAPGTHAVKVAAADNLGNATDSTRTFELHATSRACSTTSTRSCTEGLIDKRARARRCRPKLDTQLTTSSTASSDAFVNQVEAQRGKSIDVATANRLIAFAQDLDARS